MILIGIVGKKQSGKSTLAKSLINVGAKVYSYATPIKEFCHNVLGLTYEQCYGTDEQKNTLTKYKWEDLPHYSKMASDQVILKVFCKKDSDLPSGFMTARQVFQEFGTGMIRRMYKNVWIDYLFNQIKKDNVNLAIIDDVRFIDEAQAVKDNGGQLVKLLRGVTGDNHQSESELEKIEGFNLIIPDLDKDSTLTYFMDYFKF